ncbi:hypothetical protein ACWDE0_15535 [Streptomyces sp. 900105755]|uniref:hypothetical protein n=1 Tax=unclassified Streptomyces TaxID=2593676 RepID=UPI00089BA6CB|nr:hypothetical protein [Streptomyces sp. Ag109_O5-10]SEE97459.1 hypothetical protein SAMN05216533_4812 [Streptomyces sp. Ag109_O5-10]
MRGPKTVKVAVRHVNGDAGRRRTRAVTWAARDFRLVRPAEGRDRVELECPVCTAAVLAEVADHARTRRVRSVWAAVSALSLLVSVAALGYAVHEAGRALPALISAGVCVAVVGLVVALTAWLRGRHHIGVVLLDGPAPRRGHRIVPVRG